MKILVLISRILVGGLFIFSGLIKLNDPMGFSFKLEDYFAPDVLHLEFLVPYALIIAVFVVIFEVLLGVMILIGYARKFTVWSLLLMIVFFTFLTFYSAYFNKVTDCGCFGDAIKLTPWESFTKDIILLVFILILFFGKKHITPFFTKNSRKFFLFAALLFCVFITYQVLNHLPYIDFRAYKVGSNIPQSMALPENAPKAIYEYSWKFDIQGTEKIVVTNGSYPTVDGEFISVDTKLIKKGYLPPILDFSIENEQENVTDEILETDKLILVIVYNIERSESYGFANIKKITDEAIQKGYTVVGLSASIGDPIEQLKTTHKLNFDFYFCDQTVLKTIVRSNPGILQLNKGTIKQKLHWIDALDLHL
ncbi:MAG: DoxX family protein [Flavobacteriaceae bacterium CG_4_8_14_3_um_filter_34_10]|nr:DoxX family protein [Flavobacteriia bacterium]OIP52001.1 MAG: DoxX family protein [Flavobacteriaceae bacterium CG2_30_34_30]PIQ17558.1 MAG: DoxX family protein [Flavobacteriaceae bacterium CG18_big_fil_WC_8_21_14_2_50_34_36]PIV49714.1 MAG: DoxX family protein [Flavobacteriaceae bacterium CG02_land_8_20_14_3_00_34_13]PIX08896.1 MAG: DoxX family protein [Flavobacteriaceae bacterium CG_4_8_14_3_um_filter_34_10]PIZ07192.1 MAG: DoxX family protein [Flavobacteriaceae bacterium CG_4_10_14_0_8_um_f